MGESVRQYIKLARPMHYVKNALVFVPLLFSGLLANIQSIIPALIGFVAFSLAASAVYVFNDIHDYALDRLHPKKKFRPIASGKVSIKRAWTYSLILSTAAFALLYVIGAEWLTYVLLTFYIIINIIYSMGLKNIPVIDVLVLSLGFVVRVYFGASIIGVEVSKWLYLAILSFSFYLSLGKRRNEVMANGAATRKVNRHYNESFLDKNMYVCLALTLMYYSLWSTDPAQPHKLIVFTVPIVMVIVMMYSLRVEGSESDGDPVSVLMESKPLLGMVVFYGIVILALIYGPIQ